MRKTTLRLGLLALISLVAVLAVAALSNRSSRIAAASPPAAAVTTQAPAPAMASIAPLSQDEMSQMVGGDCTVCEEIQAFICDIWCLLGSCGC